MENPIKLDDLGVPLFSETPISLPHISSASRNNSKSILDPPAAARGDRMVARISQVYRGPRVESIWDPIWGNENGRKMENVRNSTVSFLWIVDDNW